MTSSPSSDSLDDEIMQQEARKGTGPAELLSGAVSDKKVREITLVEYKRTAASEMKGDQSKFSSPAFKAMISVRIKMILNNEAPILRDVLMKRVLESFGVSRSTENMDAYEKAYKSAKVKSTKLKGQVFCWSETQDPDSYNLVRTNSDRSCDEICVQELANALCYVLNNDGAMDAETLIKKASVLLGYQRLGKNVETALTNALKWAKSSGYVLLEDDRYITVN